MSGAMGRFPGGGGAKINGIIERYKALAGENISAGDFVRYVIENEGTDTALLNATGSATTTSAILLPNGNVFIAHSSSTDYYLYGMVITISGTTISAGPDTLLSIAEYSGYKISAVLLPNGNVFIAHSQVSGDYYLYGMVVTIDGATISVGADMQLSTTRFTAYTSLCTVMLPNGNVFIAHSGEGLAYLYGMVATINGTTISGTDTKLSTTAHTGYAISAVLLPNGTVFIAHRQEGTDYYLAGTVITISGTTISMGTITRLSTARQNATTTSAVLLPNGNVFIAHSRNSGTDNYLYGLVVTISGTTISAGTETLLSSNNRGGQRAINAVLLPNGSVFIAHSFSADYYLYGMVVTISGTTINAGTDTPLSITAYTNYTASALLLPNGTVFIAHSFSTDAYLYGMIVATGGVRRAGAGARGELWGVAKTSPVNGFVDVYVPSAA